MPRALAIVATVVLFGCHNHRGTPPAVAPRTVEDPSVRIEIARLEATRGDGEDQLDELARHGKPDERPLAIRALGRLGGARSLKILVELLRDDNVVKEAAYAIGIATSLDEPLPADQAALGKALVVALDKKPGDDVRIALVEALGRAGDASVQDKLAVLSGDLAISRAVPIALGRHGRRKIALAAAARTALVEATRSDDDNVRFAATWALAREDKPPADPEASKALVARLEDPEPETRAQAALALARRKSVAAGHAALVRHLSDADWRVVVEVVRALAGDDGDATGRATVASALAHRTLDDRGIHAVIEAEQAVFAHGDAALAKLAAELGAHPEQSPLTQGWLACRAAAIAVRYSGRPLADVAGAHACPGLPEHLRVQLVAELVTAKVDTPGARATAVIDALRGTKDARVIAAMLGTFASFHGTDPAIDERPFADAIVSLIGSADVAIAGAAIDAAEAFLAPPKSPPDPTHVALDDPAKAIGDAIVARARTEDDPELAAALLELIGKAKLASGAGACRAALVGHPVRAVAARSCLKAFGEAAPPPAALGKLVPPPVDVADVIGKHLRWHVMTSRGEIVIALHPDVAPWAVATIVSLTRRGFYDNLEFHRVVPDFVVQGGDPTMTGAGGPGFTIPAEPASGAEGDGFATGGVGIADAGRDSGGSQWFIMHSRAPHLDGRYTWFGTVQAGQNLADALQIGDMVLHATIEVVL